MCWDGARYTLKSFLAKVKYDLSKMQGILWTIERLHFDKGALVRELPILPTYHLIEMSEAEPSLNAFVRSFII